MARGRVDDIFARIEANIRSSGKLPPQSPVTLDRMNQVQEELCREAFAFKNFGEIVLESGTDTYDLGLKIFQVKSFVEPKSWLQYPFWCWHDGKPTMEVVTSTVRWAELQQMYIASSHPIAGMVWDNRLQLLPAPKVTGEKLGAFFFLLPSKKMDFGDDPELKASFDRCLELGATAYLIGGDWIAKYEVEKAKMTAENEKEVVDGVHKIRHWSDRVGF